MLVEPYAYSLRIRLHDTDAAGVLFYGHLFRHAHDAYESFMEQLGFPLRDLIGAGDAGPKVRLPITRAKARYERPLRLGDRVQVELRVAEVRRRSFAIAYRFLDEQGYTCATAQTLHCLVSEDDAGLPAKMRDALTACIEVQ
ncbi:thioesterase family protein [uncultured Thiodictyon sp.]|uniref:acyl-CoA thioesterase n=1 Tax=uncultured Thiodictyon sp. TaxID=1846217 RepID=UPI0025EABC00|nr:acyl-CoA thioesterase [uncultured Thiodictyon sp.]